jgi:hypothetical protein
MKAILAALVGGLMIGAIAASHAKLPAAAPKSDVEKKADAEKAAAAKAKDAEMNAKAQDRAVANWKKNKGIAMGPAKAAPKAAKK